MHPIYLTEKDYQRLLKLIQEQRYSGSNSTNIAKLGAELKRAKIVSAQDIPENVVTMNSSIKLVQMKNGKTLNITLVYPKDADVNTRKISVLAPVGTAVLGCKKGDTIEWPSPVGTLAYKIEEVLYQPEAAGDYHL